MAFLQFKKTARRSAFRAVFLGSAGLSALLFPKLFGEGMIYAIGAYLIINGVLGIMDHIAAEGKENKYIAYPNLFAAIAAVILGALSVGYFRYSVSILPLYLGIFLLLEGAVCLVAALFAKSRLKALLVILSLLIALGGGILIIFTFGFGGKETLSRIFGSLTLLSCITEALIGLIYKNISGKEGAV